MIRQQTANEQRRRKRQEGKTHDDVEGAFQKFIEHATTETVGVKQPAWAQRLEIDRPCLALPKVEKLGHPDPGELAVQQLLYRQATAIIGCNNDFAGAEFAAEFGERVGAALGPIHGAGAHYPALAGHADKGYRYEMLVFANLDQLGDTGRLITVA